MGRTRAAYSRTGCAPRDACGRERGRARTWKCESCTACDSVRHSDAFWRAWEPPPGPRQALYQSLYDFLVSLPLEEKHAVLDQVRAWAGTTAGLRPGYRTVLESEACELSTNRYIEIGAHTITHPVLSALPVSEQKNEIEASKAALERIIGKPVTSFAYPYGKRFHYSRATTSLVRDCGFVCGCSNFWGVVTTRTKRYELPKNSGSRLGTGEIRQGVEFVVSGINSNTVADQPSEPHLISLEWLRPVHLPPLPANPSVSVLITCYNYGPHVGEAIESALEQTYAVSEIVVSDDGSSDNSCEVVESYARRESRVKLVRGRHGGMAACLNGAYAASSGHILCLLDADDVFLPDRSTGCCECVSIARGCRILCSSCLADGSQGPPAGSLSPGSDAGRRLCVRDISNAGILMGLPPTTNLSLRREVAERLFPVPAEFTGYAEQMIHRLAPLMTCLCQCGEPLAEWRQHGKNDQKATRITLKRLDRELEIMTLLWQKQRGYLESVNPEVARVFPGLEHSAYFRKLRYARARLARSADIAERYQELLASPVGGAKDICFWRAAKFLPRPLFSKALDLVMTQGVLKELLARLRPKRG